jgi:DNA polymerase-3 subunit epsilon
VTDTANAVSDAYIARLATMLGLTRPLLFIDTETTGTAPEKDRVVEIATLIVDPTGEVRRWRQLIDPGCRIPPEATAIHGITDDMVAGAPPFADVAAHKIARAMQMCDLAGFGFRRFDLKLLATECMRAGFPFDPEAVTVIDAMEVFYRKEPRDLTAALRRYRGREHTGAHGAAPDVEAAAEVLVAQLDEYPDVPRTVGALAEWAENRDPNALDVDGKIVWCDGEACIAFGKHEGLPLRRVDRGYLRWMLEQAFGASTKRIVTAALGGSYPTGPRKAAS